MPRVPLYNDGAVPLVSTGVRVPLVAQNVTAGPAVGQALVGVGALGAHMAAQMAQADDTRQLMDAESMMRQHQAEQQNFQQQNPDQNAWLPEWQKRVQSMQDYAAKLKLTKSGQQVLTRSLSRWGALQGTEIEGAAFKQSIARAKQSVFNRATKAAQAGDAVGVNKALDMWPADYTTPEEREQIRLQLHGMALDVIKTQELQNAETANNRNQPEEAIARYNKLHEIGAITQSERDLRVSGVESTKLKNDLSSLIQLSKTQAEVQSHLANAEAHYDGGRGKLNGPLFADLTKLGKNQMDQLDAQGAEDWMNIINGGVDKDKAMKELESDGRISEPTRKKLAQIIQRGVVADPIAYARLYQDANSFDGQEGSAEYSQMIKRINLELPNGPEKDSAMAALKGSVGKKQDALTRSINSMYSQAVDDLENGEFGAYRSTLDSPGAVLPKKMRTEVDILKGNIMQVYRVSPEDQKKPEIANKYEMMARKKWWENLPEKERGTDFNAYVIEDEAKKAAAYRRYQEAMASSEQFRQQNPKHTLEDVRAVLNGYMVKQKAASLSGDLPLPQGAKNDQPRNNLLPSIDSMRKLYAPNSGK